MRRPKAHRSVARHTKRTALALVAAGALCMLMLRSNSEAARIPSQTVKKARDEHMPQPASSLPANSIYRLTAKDIDGNVVDLKRFVGKPAIVANVASL